MNHVIGTVNTQGDGLRNAGNSNRRPQQHRSTMVMQGCADLRNTFSQDLLVQIDNTTSKIISGRSSAENNGVTHETTRVRSADEVNVFRTFQAFPAAISSHGKPHHIEDCMVWRCHSQVETDASETVGTGPTQTYSKHTATFASLPTHFRRVQRNRCMDHAIRRCW
jgi:hypothetical protein